MRKELELSVPFVWGVGTVMEEVAEVPLVPALSFMVILDVVDGEVVRLEEWIVRSTAT